MNAAPPPEANPGTPAAGEPGAGTPAASDPDLSELEADDAPPWGWISLICYGPAGLVALTLVWFRAPKGWASIETHIIGRAPLQAALLGLVCGALVVAMSRFLTWRWQAAGRMEATFTRLLGPLTARQCLVLAVTSAIGEELLFRAALQPYFGIPATAMVFGLLHIPFERPLLLWTPFAVAMGFLLGWLYAITGSLVAPVLTHFLINWLNLRRIRRLAGSLAVPLHETAG